MENKQKKSISILAVNSLFLIVIIFLFGSDAYSIKNNIEFGDPRFYPLALFVEFILVLLPMILYIIYTGQSIKQVLRMHRLSFLNAITIVGIMIFAQPLIGSVNYIVISIFDKIGSPLPPAIPHIKSLGEMFIGIGVIAGSAAICEEIMMRGVILRGYEKYGKKTALVVTSLLFAVMHRNVQNVAGIFFMGMLIGYFVYRTNSIYAGMVAHFTNNALVVVLTYTVNKIYDMMGMNMDRVLEEQQKAGALNMEIPTLIFFVFFVIFSIVIFTVLIVLLRYNTKSICIKDVNKSSRFYSLSKTKYKYYIPLIIGLILVSFVFVRQFYYILSLDIPKWMQIIDTLL